MLVLGMGRPPGRTSVQFPRTSRPAAMCGMVPSGPRMHLLRCRWLLCIQVADLHAGPFPASSRLVRMRLWDPFFSASVIVALTPPSIIHHGKIVTSVAVLFPGLLNLIIHWKGIGNESTYNILCQKERVCSKNWDTSKYREQLGGFLAKQKGGLLTGGASKVSASGGISQDSLKEQNWYNGTHTCNLLEWLTSCSLGSPTMVVSRWKDQKSSSYSVQSTRRERVRAARQKVKASFSVSFYIGCHQKGWTRF